MTREGFIKILKGGVIAGIGAAAFYVLEALGTADYGTYTPLVTAGLAILVNAVRVFVRENA
jgi:Na+-driven multidrug efflux pump